MSQCSISLLPLSFGKALQNLSLHSLPLFPIHIVFRVRYSTQEVGEVAIGIFSCREGEIFPVLPPNTIGQVNLGESLTARTEAFCTWPFGLVYSLVYFNFRCLDAFLFAASFRELGPPVMSWRAAAVKLRERYSIRTILYIHWSSFLFLLQVGSYTTFLELMPRRLLLLWRPTSTHSHMRSRMRRRGLLKPNSSKGYWWVDSTSCNKNQKIQPSQLFGFGSCFSAFSRVDIRVDLKIPGGVNPYVIDLCGERCA